MTLPFSPSSTLPPNLQSGLTVNAFNRSNAISTDYHSAQSQTTTLMEIALLKYGRTKWRIPAKENRTKQQQQICSFLREPFIRCSKLYCSGSKTAVIGWGGGERIASRRPNTFPREIKFTYISSSWFNPLNWSFRTCVMPLDEISLQRRGNRLFRYCNPQFCNTHLK